MLKKIAYAATHPRYLARRLLGPVLARTGYDPNQWLRVVMYRELFTMVRSWNPAGLDALEISAGGPHSPWRALEFRSYETANHPDFDICAQHLDRQFDVVIADQVFEHVLWPYRAVRNVHAMMRPGGRFINTTPFLIRRHDDPVDCSRWTELGMRHLLAEGGFDLDRIQTGSWGNRACVQANMRTRGWAPMGWGRSLRNELEFPVVVWAIATK